MHRRQFLKDTALTAAAWPFLNETPAEPTIGHGDFRYRINPNWCHADPSKTPVNDCHEMVFDRRGRILMTTNDVRNNVLVFSKDGDVLDSWGHDFPGAHGLTLAGEGSDEALFITDYERHEVLKTTLDGRVLQIFDWPADSPFYSKKEDFSPTETAVLPSGEVFVADGYGRDCIVHYDEKGRVLNVFGGKTELSNAHGIALDGRAGSPTLLVTSRADNFLKRYSLDGRLLESWPLPGAFICRPRVSGPNTFFAVLVGELPWDGGTGYVLILNEKNEVVSAPGGSVPRYENGVLNRLYQTVRAFRHPHDVLPDAGDGSLYVCQWNAGKVYPARLERV